MAEVRSISLSAADLEAFWAEPKSIEMKARRYSGQSVSRLQFSNALR